MKVPHGKAAWLLAALVTLSPAMLNHPVSASARNLADLSLEQLSNIQVSSVSGRAEPLARALGSVFVITNDDIRRSGATSIPEALRLAPNLQVARTGANSYAITARGFNSTIANKLLVLIDGRSIYTPVFSGVFWDAVDVMLEDVDRIEVISGPGGVLWGANAVNGVINILTKPAAETRGTTIIGGAGNTEANLEARYGASSGRYRVYGQASHFDDTSGPDGIESPDGNDRIAAGFRSDWEHGRDAYTVQGDVYAAEDDLEPEPRKLRGFDVLGRWNRSLDGGGSVRVQGYYDHSTREADELDTVDLEMAHAMPARGSHTLLWGGGIRRHHDRIGDAPGLAFIPGERKLTNWNVYLQDVVTMGETMVATFGARVDRNSYTGIEFLPSLRFGWHPRANDLLWAAWSRAVRTPARLDRELFIPAEPPYQVAGGPDFTSEISHVFEVGYRSQPAQRLSWAVTAFYSDLERQRSLEPSDAGAVITNDRQGNSKGIEAWGAYRVTDDWRIWLGYTRFHKDIDVRPGATDIQGPGGIGSDPDQWAKLRATFDIGKAIELDAMVRYYDELENIAVPSYVAVDFRVGWHISNRVELSLLLQNLFDAEHIEWSPGAEFERAAYVSARVRF